VISERSGYVFQDPDSQFCMPYVDEEMAFVLENLMVPREEMPALIRQYLKLAGLRLDEIHTPIRRLSQGMKQRLAIASALALEPDVLLLDEPTALLDPEGTQMVWETIRSTAAADKTLVVVEHKIEGMADLIDRVIVFTPNGEILADGRAQEVFAEHRQALADYGIWYPGVWDTSPAPVRPVMSKVEGSELADDDREPILSMHHFQGFRGGECRVAVDHQEVRPGDWVGIVGENGAGKSSLLLAIMRLIKTEGDCYIEGQVRSTAKENGNHAAFVFQNPEFQFVADSVEQEITFGLERFDSEQLEATLAAYDLLPLRERHPYQLSMGQKRRLSVAGAMVRGQRLLLLDEPTFGLDARSTFLLLERLEKLRLEGCAILMITHDMEIVRRYCTRIWRVANGRLAESEEKAWN
jgi:energy-coupling factor transport system ATP-binding protein